MLKPALLLLAFSIHEANSICFITKNETVRKEEVDRPKAVDAYHCKILCVERKECFAYVFPNHTGCVLLKDVNKGIEGECVAKYPIHIKKTADAECTVSIPAPVTVGFGYKENPALTVSGNAQETSDPITNTTRPCPYETVLDFIMPDNNHSVNGTIFYGNGIQWDNKLGSWFLAKQLTLTQSPSTYIDVTTYFRSAKCVKIDPKQFADTTACGGKVPMNENLALETDTNKGPVLHYGATKFCPTTSVYLRALDMDAEEKTPGFARDADISYIACMGGSWIYCWGNSAGGLRYTYRIASAICYGTLR